MKKLIFAMLLMISFSPIAAGSDGGVVESVSSVESLKKQIYGEFVPTHLYTRIVEVKIRQRKKGTKIYLTWHPHKVKDIAKDTFIIVKIISKIIPDFHSVSLRAIDPKSFRWTKRVLWDAVIVRSNLNFITNKADTGSDKPRSLFY